MRTCRARGLGDVARFEGRRAAVKTHVHSLTFDRRERPKFAVVVTQRGIVEVEWRRVAGNWCWFTSGTGDAKKLALPAIERIERRCGARHVSRNDIRCRYCGRQSE